MEIGYRIVRPEDAGLYRLSFAQISLWRSAGWGVSDGERAVSEAVEIASGCRKRSIRTVFHPLEYPLTNEHAAETIQVFRRLSAASDLGIIVHDEGGPGGRRLNDAEAHAFETHLREISGLCHVSIENAFNSNDCMWFWERFVEQQGENVSITLDIGHLESAGVDAVSFLRDMPERLAKRVKFVHIHHKAEERFGIRDHWPLVPGCRELEALKVLLSRKDDLWVILELDARDENGMKKSIDLLRSIG